MFYTADISLSPEAAADAAQLRQAAARHLHLPVGEITDLRVVRRTVDARRGRPSLLLKLNVYTGETAVESAVELRYQNVAGRPPVIIVGAGPAGLFAALKLLERGLRPVILEQGKDVSARKRDIARLSREHVVDETSNRCFGEGGAGAFTDGKLYTRSSKRGSTTDILRQLVHHGANPDILVDAHAHIGTDKLPAVIANIRQTIEQHGGTYHFGVKVADLIVQNAEVKGAIDTKGGRYEGLALILATGHSAHDLYELFHRRGWALEAKPFALGVRAEHPQELINEIQYHGRGYSPLLPAASYSLAAQVDGGRGAFSFCMCPGGMIVPASTAAGQLVVNGMSNSRRSSPFANSGIVAQVNLSDLAAYGQHGALAGLRFQQEVERQMCLAGGGSQTAPAQRLTDFVSGRLSATLAQTSYIPGCQSAPLHRLLPDFIGQALRQAFKAFDKKMRGYLTSEAMLLAVESRTSSPVRIPRCADTLQHVQLKNLYPCGEGAGYAGGITSSAMDGASCAEKIADLA